MTTPSISVMIPAYRDPTRLNRTVSRLKSFALNLAWLEFVIHIEEEDPRFSGLMDVALQAGGPIIVGPALGYMGLGHYFNKMFKASHGDLVWAATDDLDIMTQEWDELYRRSLDGIVYGVAGAKVHEGSNNPLNFGWAFPMVRRTVCEKVGSFCTGHVAFDRLYAAYAKASGQGVIAPVEIHTQWKLPEFGTPRDLWYSYLRDNWRAPGSHWERFNAQWTAEGKKMAQLIR